jgi:hypothetical protein
MITREDYNKALSVVEMYHKQLSISIVKYCGNDNNISKLKEGDYIRFAKEVKPIPINFTIGKLYKILDLKYYEDFRTGEPYLVSLNIKHDNGGSYWIPISNTYKRWSCA